MEKKSFFYPPGSIGASSGSIDGKGEEFQTLKKDEASLGSD